MFNRIGNWGFEASSEMEFGVQDAYQGISSCGRKMGAGLDEGELWPNLGWSGQH